MEFNAESSTVFGGLTEVQGAVSAGLNYVSAGFGNFNDTFNTSVKGLDWTKTIKTGMEVRKEAKAGFKVFGLNIDASASAGIGLSAIAKVGVTSEIKIRTGWNRAIRWFVGRIGFGIITKIDWKL